jgi:hypothetical protein
VNFLVVYFKVGTPHQEFGANLVVTIDVPEYMLETARDYAGAVLCAEHSVSLTAPCLPIREYRAVIALDDRFDQRESTFVVNHLLQRVCVVNCIIGETLRVCLLIWLYNVDLVLIFLHFNTRKAA